MITRLNRVLQERRYRQEVQSAHQKLVCAHEELQSSYLDTIHRLVLATEYKDEDTGDHIIRIGRFCTLLARQFGLPEKEVQDIGYAAPMHDIGKIGIPDQILLKPGKLTAREFEIMKTHTTIGGQILAKSKSEIIQCAQEIAVTHHERWDGTGYPKGLSGDRIPLTGRIVALADTFDALTNKRPYKPPYPLDLALQIMRKEKGAQFDPELLEVFMKNIDSIVAIKTDVEDIKHGGLSDFLLGARDEVLDLGQALK
jgi:putative two-component system response regulator